MIRTLILTCISLLLFVQESLPQKNEIKGWELKGYVKDLQGVSFIDNPNSLITSNLIHNRINLKWNFEKHFYIRLEIRNRIFYGEQVKLIPGFGEYINNYDGYFKISKLWVDEKTIVAHAIADRLLLNYTNEKISISAGRQRINWGINVIWNPNDLFNAYNFLDFDYEERPGVDALNIQYFLKTNSSLEFAYKPSKEKKHSIAAALYKFNKWKYDLQFLVGMYNDDIAIGTGWAGNIKDAGFKGEATYFRNRDNFSNDGGVFSTSVTADYSFKNNWYSSFALLYQHNPVPVVQSNSVFLGSNLSPKNLMPYRYSFYLGAMKEFTPLLRGNVAFIYSPTKNSTIFFPSIAYNVAQNFDLDLTIQSFFAETLNKFKTQGNSVYIRIKYNF